MRLSKLVPLVAAALLAVACSGSSKGSSNLSVSAKGAPNGAVSRGALQVSPTLSVDRVRLVVSHIELEPVEAPPGTAMPPVMDDSRLSPTHDGEGGDDDHPEGEIGVGPFLIDLSGGQLAGPVTTAFDAEIPPGTYHELRLVVAPIAPADAGPSTGLRDMATLEASVAIDGTAGTGQGAAPFHVALPVRAFVKKETTFQVGAGTTNVTVPVDVAAWLAGVADPTSDAGKAMIEANVRAALRVFVDDDEDDEEDD